MQHIKTTVNFFTDIITGPDKASCEIGQKNYTLLHALLIYAAYTAVNSVFLAVKPLDFPAAAGPVSAENFGFSSWLFGEAFWGSILLAAWSFFLVLFCSIMRGGRLAVRMILTSVFTLPAAALIALYRNSIPQTFHAVFWIMFIAVSAFVSYRRKNDWQTILLILLAGNAVAALFIPVKILAVSLRTENIYMAAELISSLWMIAVTALLLRRLTKISAARAVISIFFSSIMDMALLVSLYKLNLVPHEIMKMFLTV